MITLTINGKKEKMKFPISLLDYLATQEVNLLLIAVGYNGQVIHRNHWHKVVLNGDDVVDIVQMVGGG